MPTFDELKNTSDSPSQVHKIVEAVAFLAPASAEFVDSLTDETGSLTALPEEYVPVGLVSTDGFTFGGDTNVEAVEALGYSQPVREDITSRTRTVAFTPLEAFRRPLLELVYGVDLSNVTAGTNGEITFDHPDRPQQRYYRLVVIGKDGVVGSELYRGKAFPRASVTEFPEEVWNASDPVQYSITMSTYIDDEVGTGERDFIAGPGVTAADLGFEAAGV